VDGRLRWAGGRYDMSAYVGVSHVTGDSLAILGQQLSPRRYYQRPDAGHVDVETGRTSLTGVTAGINHSKLAGNWRWDVDYTHESPALELNDIGSLGSADDRGLFWDIWYRQTRPGMFQYWDAGFFQGNEWNFDGDRKFTEAGVWWSATLRNSFLRPSAQISGRLRALSDDQTRGGPLMLTPSNWTLDLALRSNRNARTSWDLEFSMARNELDGRVLEGEARLAGRPGTQWEMSIEGGYRHEIAPRQFVTTRGGGSAATFGGRYVFARIARSQVVAQLRAAYAVTPDLTVEAYLEPFAASGRYRDFGELEAARSFALRTYGSAAGTTLARTNDSTYTVTDGAQQFTFGVPDFDVRSLRSNLVLRWEWQPGSTLFLVWQQDRGRRARPTGDVGPGGLLDAFETPGDHFLALKVSYWLALR
jgi:hypothetical protein